MSRRGPGFARFPRHGVLRVNDLVPPTVGIADVRAALAADGLARFDPSGRTERLRRRVHLLHRVLGAPFTLGYQGIAFRKDAAPLREAVTEALRGLIADGTYKAILTKYGLAANAVAEPLLNAAPQ